MNLQALSERQRQEKGLALLEFGEGKVQSPTSRNTWTDATCCWLQLRGLLGNAQFSLF